MVRTRISIQHLSLKQIIILPFFFDLSNTNIVSLSLSLSSSLLCHPFIVLLLYFCRNIFVSIVIITVIVLVVVVIHINTRLLLIINSFPQLKLNFTKSNRKSLVCVCVFKISLFILYVATYFLHFLLRF